MKTASSIRYGGMLIDANECDYNSFKHLGLLCPICKRTVFLVGETDRSACERKNKDGSTSQVKSSHVSAYFAHHPEVDKNTVNDCELKSSQITVTERLYLEAKAHNQRQKVFHAHFWKILSTSWMIREFDECRNYAKLVYIKACVTNERKASFMYQELINTMIHKNRIINEENWNNFVQNRIVVAKKRILGRWIETSKTVHEDVLDALTENELIEISKDNQAWNSEIDERMQLKIVLEALLFICQKKQVKILQNLTEYTLDKAIHQIMAEQLKTLPSMGGDEYVRLYHGYMRQTIGATDSTLDVVFSYMRIALVDSFVAVRWGYQFETLEQKELERQR